MNAPFKPVDPVSPKIISCAEAVRDGLTRYFTGETCCRGHVAQRYTVSHSCVACHGRSFGTGRFITEWTEERDARLKELWSDGLSASQISAKMDDGTTRNAILGRIHRLGLSGRVRPAGPPRSLKVTKAARSGSPLVVKPPRKPNGDEYQRGRSGASGKGLVPVKRIAARFVPPAPVIAPESRFLTIVELTAITCRWPLGDPHEETFRYCGGACEVEKPYCSYHSQLSYAPDQRRRAA